MALRARDLQTLQKYIQGVLNRADHHAGKVKGTVMAICGGIIWRGDLSTIEIRTFRGDLANLLWVEISGKRYCFAYNHHTQKIEIRDRTQEGPALHSLDDYCPSNMIEAIFRSL